MLAALLAGYLLLSLLLLWDLTPVDDAFITFRYARNLVAGGGLSFNPSERVEGYSSLSWLLLMAAGEAIGLDLPGFSKALGLFFGLATLTLISIGPFDAASRLLTIGLLALHLPWTYHAINGLETVFVSFLVTALNLMPASSRNLRSARHIFAITLVITRPEGLGLVIIIAVAVLLADRTRFSRHHLAICASALAAFATQTAWRWFYHGDWIANSARAKLMPMSIALPRGLEDLGHFAFYAGAYGVVPLLAATGVVLALRRRRDPGSGHVVALLAFCLLAGLSLAASGGDSFALWRFFVPIAPVSILCAARGLHLLLRHGWHIARVASWAVLALALVHSANSHIPKIRAGVPWGEQWKDIGMTLAKSVPPETRIALSMVGIIPYYSELYTVDLLGLNDRVIARRPPDPRYYGPGHQRHDGPYVLGLQPDLLILAAGSVVSDPYAPFPWDSVRIYERDIITDPRFASNYRLIRIRLLSGKYLQVFASTRFLARYRSDQGGS